MSIIALFMAFFLLFLSMHACSARHTFDFVPYSKVVEKARLHEIEIKGFPGFNTKEILLGGKVTSMDALDANHRAVKMEDLKEKARSMVEITGSKETKKQHSHVNANEEDEPIEDPMVMDYVQVHRATPIHNLN